MIVKDLINKSSRRHNRRISRIGLISLLAMAVGCSAQSFDYLTQGTTTIAEGSGGNPGVSGGNGTGGSSSTDVATGGNGGAGQGGSATAVPGTGGAVSNTGGAATGGSSTAAPGLGPWNFDTEADTALWAPSPTQFPAGASKAWDAQGETDPLGAMIVTATGNTIVQFNVPTAGADQSNRRLNFRVRTASGIATFKPFVMSIGYVWSDGGEQAVTTAWSTASISISMPSYEAVGYDPTNLIQLGFQIPCPGTTAVPVTWVLWIDRIWFQ